MPKSFDSDSAAQLVSETLEQVLRPTGWDVAPPPLPARRLSDGPAVLLVYHDEVTRGAVQDAFHYPVTSVLGLDWGITQLRRALDDDTPYGVAIVDVSYEPLEVARDVVAGLMATDPALQLLVIGDSAVRDELETDRRVVYMSPPLSVPLISRAVELLAQRWKVYEMLYRHRTQLKVHTTPDHELKLASTAPTGRSVRPAHAPRAVRVLVAEDSLPCQLTFVRILERDGFVVDACDNGLTAVSLAKSNDYALIILDMQLPGCSGLEATAQIRRAETNDTRVPIMALSGDSRTRTRRQALFEGADAYELKPISRTRLLERVRWLTRQVVLTQMGATAAQAG